MRTSSLIRFLLSMMSALLFLNLSNGTDELTGNKVKFTKSSESASDSKANNKMSVTLERLKEHLEWLRKIAITPEQKTRADAFAKKFEQIAQEFEVWSRDMEKWRKLPSSARGGPPPMPRAIPDFIEKEFFPADESGKLIDTGNDQQDEQMQILMQMAAAGLCVVQPEICPFVAIIIPSLGGSSSDLQKDVEFLKGIQGAVNGGEVDSKLIEDLTRRINELGAANIDPKLAAKLGALPGEKSSNEVLVEMLVDAFGDSDYVGEAIETYPLHLQKLIAALQEGPDPYLLCRVIPSDENGPYFSNEQERRLTEAAIKYGAKLAKKKGVEFDIHDRYWRGFLAKIGMQDDENRENPCE